MYTKCPGQDFRHLTSSIHRCPHCGGEVEMFSDEMKVRCPHCKAPVEKEQVPSCIQWCREAKRCLGPQRWAEIMETIGKEK